MDPFNEVKEDAIVQIKNLREFVRVNKSKNESRSRSRSNEEEFRNEFGELKETIEDLKESVDNCKRNPLVFGISEEDIQKREEIIRKLSKDCDNIKATYYGSSGNGNGNGNEYKDYNGDNGDNGDNNNDNNDNGDYNLYREEQISRIIEEQDYHLDSIYDSMVNINGQARLMGEELNEQEILLEEVSGNIERVDGKLKKGMKRINYILKNDRDRLSDCCIGLLIAVLIILLVLLIIL
ncbi:Tlg1p ASCRUDRAFT_69763 [Ascoidea rubescens DSM 1968]|uniref:t-SNARE coiled-coil homology domain-containing protein n=1 Tax=Ascoidea rubescens DSM 1968 TaxID=1344418 RepID=A0A1D2VKF6_9ASCO|nr:hypothetical protein ASCRUDRAFT_69763 [Ascoidea rubescens DSM 1968]ODV62075.1 hypothetical protein ASCRUDRAFT_69763 [Ascoidea rubescens DSM 1968]